ncbi:MAG: SDR family NAD(P)-dependent oxidoreductase [Thermoanaerobaculia bacterium]
MTKPLSGKNALVTGASRGIGRAIALRLAADGAHVAAGVRHEEASAEIVAALREAGGDGIAVVLDVTDPASVATAVERAARPQRRLDVVVNNAGIAGVTPLGGDQRSDERWARMLDVNLTGTWRVCRAAYPFLADGGRIVNLSSVSGRFGVALNGAYCASKHGIIGLTRALALELAPRKITVNALCPGWVDTEMGRHGIRGFGKQASVGEQQAFEMAAKMTPLGAVLTPGEIAGLVAYLVSDDARNVTGQAIVIDGGQVMP